MQDPTLQNLARPVEAAVCHVDRERGFRLTDAQAIQIFDAAQTRVLSSRARRARRLGRAGRHGRVLDARPVSPILLLVLA